MYNSFRCLAEGDNVEEKEFERTVGFMKANVALIGRHWGISGYEKGIAYLLICALNKLLTIADPDLILLGIGFGTKGHSEKPYLDLLEETFLGKLQKDYLRIENCNSDLFELKFENSGEMKFLGYRHPSDFAHYNSEEQVNCIVDFIKNNYAFAHCHNHPNPPSNHNHE